MYDFSFVNVKGNISYAIPEGKIIFKLSSYIWPTVNLNMTFINNINGVTWLSVYPLAL